MKIDLNGWADSLNTDKYVKVKNMAMMALLSEGHGCDWTIEVKQVCDASRVYDPHVLEVIARRVFAWSPNNKTYNVIAFTIRVEQYTIKNVFEESVKVLRNKDYVEKEVNDQH